MEYQWEIKRRSMLPFLYLLLGIVLIFTIWVTLALLVTSATAIVALFTGKASIIDLVIPLCCLCLVWGFAATARGIASITLHVTLTDALLEYRTLTKRLAVPLTNIGTLRLLKNHVSFWEKLLFTTKYTPVILEIRSTDARLTRMQVSLPNAEFSVFSESVKTIYPAAIIE